MKLTNQTILLTGGTSGVGLALLRALSGRGNRLVVVGRHAARWAALAPEFPDATFVACDLAIPADVAALRGALPGRYPGLSVLINCAGVQFNYVLGAETHSAAHIEAEIYTNLTAAVQLVDGLLPTLRQQPSLSTSARGWASPRNAQPRCTAPPRPG